MRTPPNPPGPPPGAAGHPVTGRIPALKRPPPPPALKAPPRASDTNEEIAAFAGGSNPFNLEDPAILNAAPAEPKELGNTGLKLGVMSDIALRYLYYAGSATGLEVAETLRLPWTGVVEHVIDHLADEKLVDMRGGKGFGRASVDFQLTEKGREYARDAMSRSTYVGPAPVPLEQYIEFFKRRRRPPPVVSRAALDKALSHLIIAPALAESLGPAVNSSRSLFLYGPPGNGKTTIAEAISSMYGGEVFVPFSLSVDGLIIKVFDHLVHRAVPLELDEPSEGGRHHYEMDRRWQLCKRPAVVVGGELTLATLDLIYSETSRFYEAPFQVKANGGMLLIDDFGRQKVHPTDLLNRWIVPLEKRVDYLTLHTGKKFEIPFDQLVVFSTNLEPKQLVDEAFLRRIKYKIEVGNPDEQQYREIFRRVCETSGIQYLDHAVGYLFEQHYKPRRLDLRACHPRDLISLIKDAARFAQVPPSLSKELLDQACGLFFVDL